ncbi:MAG: hypothetical protein IT184_06485 [Acidobacteria bacterium]|nr:hypothetical protein [Acidobacteriota bacterium]
MPTVCTEVDRLAEVVLKHPRDAFRDAGRIAREWQALNFSAAPDLARAIDEHERFAALVADAGARVRFLPEGDDVGLDALYVRDASVATPKGMVLCRMGKALRGGEPAAQRAAFEAWGIPLLGEVQAPGQLEGGDVVWLTSRIVAVGRGYRTNDAGIAQLTALLGDLVDEVITVPLVHWRGPGDVFHLMSILSPVDRDLAVVYSPLMPVTFRERLLSLGVELIEVPDGELESMGANVLAVAPRHCVMLEGNPVTRARLEARGAVVRTYAGVEISVKGGGGPTCLTRPISRAG